MKYQTCLKQQDQQNNKMPHVPNLCLKDSKDKKQIKLNTQNVLKWTKFNSVNCWISTKKLN